ncbi:hypothetical protein ABPG75_002838 [Micractinium tetrahymenae]
MPATWAELRGGLAALLDLFAAPPSVDSAARVWDAAMRWRGLAADLPLPPPDAERAALPPLLWQLGPALADWDAPLQRLLQAPSALLDAAGFQAGPATQLFIAGTMALGDALKVARHVSAAADDLLQLSRGARLLLGSGRVLAERAAQAVQLSPSPVKARLALSRGTADTVYLLWCLMDAVERAGLLGSFAAQSAPPQALLAWLPALAGTQQSVPLRELRERSGAQERRKGGE